MRGTMMDYPLTLRMLFERGTRLFPDQEIVTGTTHRYTYREFGERVHRLGSALQAMGIRPGDRVASFAWNTYRHLELYFAVPMIGAVLHTVNIRLFHDQLTHIVNHAADRLVFADRSLVPTLEKLRPSFTSVERFVSMEDGSGAEIGDALDYEALLERGSTTCDFPDVDEAAAAAMCYTSGTTGNPKGVAYSHRALVLHSLAEGMADAMGLSMRDTVMPIVPLFHANCWGIPFTATLVGAKQVFPGVAPKPQDLLELLARERVTLSAGVPTIWIGLQPLIAAGTHDLSQLREVFIGGSAVPPSLLAAYDKLGIRIVQAWGMTETTPLGSMSRLKPCHDGLPQDEQLRARAKQGLSMPGVEARAVDEEGRDVPRDGQTMGELIVRGPWVTGSYYKGERPEAFTEDGWFRTGDVVTIDGDCYIEIADRTKDLIKSGGEWISSVALEGALMAHPKVLEAAVVAVPDEKWAERPLACVVPRPEARGAVEDAELTAFLGERFAKWWLPERYVYLEELPKTSVGKFDKKVLRQRYAEAGAPA